jgi:putative phosphonate catabolism associated alcohol dehydrogenase
LSSPTPTPVHADSCRAAVFLGADRPLELREFPVPQVAAGEALARVACCTICGSDLHTITGARVEPVPSILGHEVLGVVDRIGDPPLCDIDGRPLSPGDRVTWSTSVSCGACDRCRNGLPQKCRSLAKYGHGLAEGRCALSGGLAEFILLRPGSAVLKIGPEVPDEVACPVNCATASIASAYRTAGRCSGQRVLIFGAGLLGLTAAAFARSHGAAQVVVCDADANRLARAERFGADRAVAWSADAEVFQERVNAGSEPALFDVILELSGSPDAVEAACRLGDVGARVILVGTVMKCRAVRLDPERVVRQWLSIHGVHNYTPDDLRTAVAFLKQFQTEFPFAELVERTYPLTNVNEAIRFAIEERPVRVAVRPWAGSC